jgi:hypothetical protein
VPNELPHHLPNEHTDNNSSADLQSHARTHRQPFGYAYNADGNAVCPTNDTAFIRTIVAPIVIPHR